MDTFGRIDYAANFAGIVGPLEMTWDVNLDDWRKVIEVNSIGLFICNKHELKQMIKQSSINVYVAANRPTGDVYAEGLTPATEKKAGHHSKDQS